MVTKKLEVSAIENGTVIDHIPSKSVFVVVKILGLEDSDNTILIGTNFDSKKLPSKGIIKVRDRYFKKNELNKISLVAPQATHIVIQDFNIKEKTTVHIPNTIEGIVRCVNPNCITNVERIQTKFVVISKEPIKLRCHYCEKITDKNDITFND